LDDGDLGGGEVLLDDVALDLIDKEVQAEQDAKVVRGNSTLPDNLL
jgi:hypothetical protein